MVSLFQVWEPGTEEESAMTLRVRVVKLAGVCAALAALALIAVPALSSGSNSEEVILGRARGEQRSDGTYHGHITILSLFGNEILGVDSNPGQSEHGPLNAVQTQVLNNLCSSSGGQLCVNVVTADSATTATGSTNHFEVAHANVGASNTGLVVDAANSDGNISNDANCQSATGDSSVAQANAGGGLVAAAV